MDKIKLKDHRRYPRKNIKWSGVIKYRDHIISINTVDVSEQGVMVESKFKIKNNQYVFLVLNCDYEGKKMMIYAKTRVKQVTVNHYIFNLILIFEEISPKSRAFISNFITSHQQP